MSRAIHPEGVCGAGSAVRLVCLTLAIVLVCCARRAGAGQFTFQDLEQYYLHNYRQLASGDAGHSQLSSYAGQYAMSHFPLGSSVSTAVSALASGDDPVDPPSIICDWSRTDCGLSRFCCEIDWFAVIETDEQHKKIQNIIMNRTETGP